MNKGEWYMLGMSGVSGGATSAPGKSKPQSLVIWKWKRLNNTYTVGFNGGGNPVNGHGLSLQRDELNEEQANAYVEEIKQSDSSVNWTVKSTHDTPH